MPPGFALDDARPRSSPFGDGLTMRHVADEEWHVRSEHADEFLSADGVRLDEWVAAGVAAVVKSGPHRTVYRLALGSGVYYLKHYKLAGPRAWLQNNLRSCRAYREAAANARVRSAGIDTAEVVAVGRRAAGPFSRDSFFLCREIAAAVPLDAWLGERGASAPWSSAKRQAVRRGVIERLAGLTATLHRCGLFHADYHAGNMLVRIDGDAVKLSLIDLHPLRAARMTTARRWAMLGMLASSLAPRATRIDRRRFFKAYRKALGTHDDARVVETHCSAEVRRRQRRADRKWRRGNRRVMILDRGDVACRGLAEVGVETLTRLGDELSRTLDHSNEAVQFFGRGAVGEGSDGASLAAYAAKPQMDNPQCKERVRSQGIPSPLTPLPRERGTRSDCLADSSWFVRRLPVGGDARAAWETGHALCRRGFPVARPVLFVAARRDGVLVADRASADHDGLGHPHSLLPQAPVDLGRLLRRLHDVGFDASPEAFGAARDGSIVIERPEYVVRRRMWSWRRRNALVRLMAERPVEDRDDVLQGYGAEERLVSAVLSRLPRTSPASQRGLRLRRPRVAAAILLAVAVLFAGCRTIDKPPPAPVLPAKHSVRADHLVLVSDFKLSKDDPLVAELIELREDVVATLRLPEPRQDVSVYLFANEESYRQYLDSVHPGLPSRRAYFVGTKNELAVYTYWGDRIQEDLRHEYTHGILHASLAAVPLWLDEGLAEYFEVPGATPGGMNGDYPHQLAVAVANGWRPDIDRLEQLEEFSQMRRLDYQESWGWVHYLLHASPDTRQELLGYVADLRDATHPPPLAERVAAIEPGYPARFLGYVAGLNSTGGAVIRAASAEL